MKRLQKIVAGLVLAAALAIAGLIEAFNFLAARQRDQVIQELQKVLGQDVTYASLEVNVFGRPGFVAREFRIADDPRFAATPAVRAQELVLGVSLWSLLLRQLVVTSLIFEEPEFQIITDESGRINLTRLLEDKSELRKLPRLRSPGSERRQPAVRFAIEEVTIKRGRVEYIDRSVRQPAELRVKNVSMTLQGVQPGEKTSVRIAAALAEGLGQDVRIKGEIASATADQPWSHRAIDFSIEFDSLHVPVVAHAIAAVRDKIPRQLDVTGPMALQVNARGTAARPRLEDIVLKVPLFGSSEYNAVITGAIEFTERRNWEDAKLNGTLTLDPLALARVRSFRVFEHILPMDLRTDGNVKITSRFEGTWNHLRLGMLVRADNAELGYDQWLHKPANMPAAVRAQISRRKNQLLFHESSSFSLGANTLYFSGAINDEPEAQLQLKIRGNEVALAAWSRLFTAAPFAGTAGTVAADLIIQRSLRRPRDQWSLGGVLRLSDATLQHKASGRLIENARGTFVFEGSQARLENGRFRIGSSVIFLNGRTDNILAPRMVATVRSPDLTLSGAIPGGAVWQLKNLIGQTEIFFEHDDWTLSGSFTAPEGHCAEWPLHEVRGDIVWTSGAVSIKNFHAKMFDGTVHGTGFSPGGAPNQELQFSAAVENIDASALLARIFPPLRQRIAGRLGGRGDFALSRAAGENAALKGTGEIAIERGMIRSFNLITHLLMKGSGRAGSAADLARVPPGFAALFSRPDTPVQSFNADFTIEHQRITSENLLIATPDYTITGAGWIGFDRTTRWNGLLVLSPQLTQQVQRDYRILRYLLDRRGRLAVAFRLEGRIPDVTVRLENRALAQALRSEDGERENSPQSSIGAGGAGKKWLPDALERFLNR